MNRPEPFFCEPIYPEARSSSAIVAFRMDDAAQREAAGQFFRALFCPSAEHAQRRIDSGTRERCWSSAKPNQPTARGIWRRWRCFRRGVSNG